MSNSSNILHDMLSAYEHTSRFKDDLMVEIMCRKQEFEKHLDEMWAIYRRGNTRQIVNYQKQVDDIKNAGLKVLRNSQGKHKITYK